MSNPVVRTYARVLYPGLLMAEEQVKPVESRDPQALANSVGLGAFAFQFFDRAQTKISVGGRDVEMDSDPFNPSPLYYIDAELFTAAEVAMLPGDNVALLSNMRTNGWVTMVRCRTGNWRPLLFDDKIVRTS